MMDRKAAHAALDKILDGRGKKKDGGPGSGPQAGGGGNNSVQERIRKNREMEARIAERQGAENKAKEEASSKNYEAHANKMVNQFRREIKQMPESEKNKWRNNPKTKESFSLFDK